MPRSSHPAKRPPTIAAGARGPASDMKPCFRAEVRTDGVLEVIIYDQIGEYEDWWSGETIGIGAKTVKKKMDGMEYKSILLRINSPGGDAFEGVAILNLLRSQNKPVTVKIDGLAASAASIIAMAGTSIEMGSGAMMMIHNAWGFCMGNTHEMAHYAASLAAIDKSIASIYVERSGVTLENVTAMMDAETWLGAEECIAQGFATGMQEAQAIDPKKALAMASTFRAMAKFAKVPASLRPTNPARADDGDDEVEDAACECSCSHCADGECSECSASSCDDPNCTDCPMQDVPADASNRWRIDMMASTLRTRASYDVQVGGRGVNRILALRKHGTSVVNLVEVSGKPMARITGVMAPYGVLSCDLGGFCEEFLPGAFADSLPTADAMILVNHDINAVLGRQGSGTARLHEESDGLHYEVDTPDTQASRDLQVLMQRGDIAGASSAFFIEKYHWEMRSGVRVRVIEKASLVEGGPHSLGAYGTASATIENPAPVPVEAEIDPPAAQPEEVEIHNSSQQYEARLRLLKMAS